MDEALDLPALLPRGRKNSEIYIQCGDGGYQIKVEEHNEKVTKQLHP